jgi:hypothetical protein
MDADRVCGRDGACIRITTDDSSGVTGKTAGIAVTAGTAMPIANCVQDEVQEIFDRLDRDGDRSIAFEEFARLMLDVDHTSPEAALRASFDAIDLDHDGCVSFEEFRAWISR